LDEDGRAVMASVTMPRTAVENWERVRDEWVAEIERLISEAESWCGELDWGTRREPMMIEEDELGTYTVPRLLILGTSGRFLLEPVARFVAGAEGRVDLWGMSFYDPRMIVRMPEGWFVLENDAEGPRSPWSAESFLASARALDVPA